MTLVINVVKILAHSLFLGPVTLFREWNTTICFCFGPRTVKRSKPLNLIKIIAIANQQYLTIAAAFWQVSLAEICIQLLSINESFWYFFYGFCDVFCTNSFSHGFHSLSVMWGFNKLVISDK